MKMEKIRQLIEDLKINKSFLAFKMDMLKGTFCNKLSEKHPTKFRAEEKKLLKKILIEIGTKLMTILN